MDDRQFFHPDEAKDLKLHVALCGARWRAAMAKITGVEQLLRRIAWAVITGVVGLIIEVGLYLFGVR